jgi:recombination protein RecT
MSNSVMTWADVIDQSADKFNQIANRAQLVTWAEESQFAIQAIQKNEKLSQCVPVTVQNAIINVASVGLTLNHALGYAYLVPESVKQKDQNGRDVWVQECLLRVSFKGLLKIATDSGSILWAKAEIVKASDEFEYLGVCTPPSHKMNPFKDRGATIGCYCVAKTHQGDFLVDFMSMDDINKVKGAAKTKTVWDAWFDEMVKKAMIKRASKQWPKTDRDDRLDRAIAVVNEYEGSEEPLRQEREINPQPTTAVKSSITNARLNAGMKKIIAGEYTIQQLESTFLLNESQSACVDKWVAGAEWVDLPVEAAQ